MAKQTENTAPSVVIDGETVSLAGVTRPESLASALRMSPKVLRGYLRQHYTRPIEQKGTSWTLSADVVQSVADHFVARMTKSDDDVTADADTDGDA